MSLFGKFLGILNVLAAIGFVALAVMDWQARHQWTYAVFLHERAIEGLPLDDTELDASGNPLVADLTDKGITAILGTGSKVKTQKAAVDAVKSELQGKINDSNLAVKNIDGFDITQSPLVAPHQKLAYVLLPLAGTIQERDDLRNVMLGVDAQGKPLTDEAKAKLAESLQSKFDQAFSKAIQENSTSEGGAPHRRNIEERKQAVARLLFNLRDRFEEPAAAGANPWDVSPFSALKPWLASPPSCTPSTTSLLSYKK